MLMPAGLLLVLVLPLTGRIADMVPHHVPIFTGLICFAAGVAMMSTADVNTPFWTFALFVCVSRFGLAFIIPSLNVGALSTLPPAQLTRGSGSVNFIRQLGGAVGTNLIVVWLQLRSSFHHDGLMATQTASNKTSQELLTSVTGSFRDVGMPAGISDSLALDYLANVVQAQALTLGFKDCFLALAVVFIAALIPTWFFSRIKAPASDA